MPFDGRVEAEGRNDSISRDNLGEPLAFGQINDDGFGNCLNTYSWSMVWFKGNLYVGTNKGSFLQAIQILDPDFDCVGNDPTTDPAAEIWRYSPLTGEWDRVFQSPNDVPIWGQPGVFTARDNGFRDMIVFTEPDGTEALYVAGVIYPFLFETRRPRILRSTDGTTFEPLPQDPGTVLGEVEGTSFRALASYKGRLYVTIGSVIGEGIILEGSNPSAGNDNFRRVSPTGMLAFELIEFNNFLYVGSGEASWGVGFHVYKTDATPNTTGSYDFVPVISNGGDGPYWPGPNNAVLSMTVFQGRLYVGGQNDLFRLNPDDSWELVVGNPRETALGQINPISGLPQGFGNWLVGHLWRMESHEGSLYVGTWDFSTFLRIVPLIGPWIDLESGFDLWKTEDGIHWSQITRNGLDSKFNHGVRGLESTPYGLFLGTTNPWDGTQVYLGQPSAPAPLRAGSTASMSSASRGSSTTRSLSLASPRQLDVEGREGGTVLAWEPSARAARFRVLRATHTPNREIGAPELSSDAWLVGDYDLIGTTTQPFYRDATVSEGYRYSYFVQAEGTAGELSSASNIVTAPALALPVTFDSVKATVGSMVQRRKFRSPRSGMRFSSDLTAARGAAEKGQWLRARRLLESLHKRIEESSRRELDRLAAEDLAVLVSRLSRRVKLSQQGAIPIWDVLGQPGGQP
jgi:hypothetical protein